jgi:hypothetical protein
MLLLSAALAQGLSLEIHTGLTEERDLFREGMETTELARGMPNGGLNTVIVRVPEEWLKPPEELDAAEAYDPQQVDEMVRAMKRLPRQSAYEESARLAAFFRNGAFEQARPRERYTGVLQLWEVLWEHQTADTLSASIATLSVMGELDLAGSLARYPCGDSDSGRAFGVLVPGTSKEGVGWSYPAGDGALLTLHPNARPDHDEVAYDQLEVWELEAVLAPGWDPVRPGEPAPAPRQKDRPPPKEEQLQNWNYYALSAASGVGAILLVGMLAFRTRASRRRALAAKKRRHEDRF